MFVRAGKPVFEVTRFVPACTELIAFFQVTDHSIRTILNKSTDGYPPAIAPSAEQLEGRETSHRQIDEDEFVLLSLVNTLFWKLSSIITFEGLMKDKRDRDCQREMEKQFNNIEANAHKTRGVQTPKHLSDTYNQLCLHDFKQREGRRQPVVCLEKYLSSWLIWLLMCSFTYDVQQYRLMKCVPLMYW